jgi:uncharacterized repeat protein (TIGR01451 family)
VKPSTAAAALLVTLLIAATIGPAVNDPVSAALAEPGVTITVGTNAGTGTFSFTSDIPGAASFDVDVELQLLPPTDLFFFTGSRTFDAPPGSYTITQLSPPAPFTFSAIEGIEGCTPGGGMTALAEVPADGQANCGFSNVQTAVMVEGTTIGGDRTYAFTSDIPGHETFNVGPGEVYVASVPPGTYSITESGPLSPFEFVRIEELFSGDEDESLSTCGAPARDLTAVAEVVALEEVGCKFVNRLIEPVVDGPFVGAAISAVTSPRVDELPVSGPTIGMGALLPAVTGPPGAPDVGFTVGGIGRPNGAQPSAPSPLDTVGAVGPGHYVQMVNSSIPDTAGSTFAIFAKTGNLLSGPHHLNSLWSGLDGSCTTTETGDPIVLYDQLADRWLLSHIASVTSGSYGVCVAVSRTADPLGSYSLYTFPLDTSPDYPKLGVWPDGYYLSTNPAKFQSAEVRVLDRDAMLAGEPASTISFKVDPTNFLLPSDLDGSAVPPPGAPNWFTTFGGPDTHAGGPSSLDVYAFSADFDQPAQSSLTREVSIAISAFRGVCQVGGSAPRKACVPQPGVDQRLAPLDDYPMFRSAYRNFGEQQTIVGAFSHGVGTEADPIATTRWWEIRRTDIGWSLHQEGDVGTGDPSRWTASAAMDRNGGLAVGYSASSTTVFPSIRYSARGPGQTLGAIGPETVMVAGSGSQLGSNRWGDYSAMTVDPVDDCTFWYTTNYYAATGEENRTAIGTFRRPDCGQVALSLDKTTTNLDAVAGQTITYTLNYGNAAGDAAEVVLTETVPANTTFAGPAPWQNCPVGAPAGTVCTLTIGSLGPDAEGSTTFDVTVDDQLPGGITSIVNTAVLSAGYGGGSVSEVTSTPILAPTAPTTVPAAPILPKSGAASRTPLVVAIALLMAGSALMITSARRDRRRSGSTPK